MNIRLPLARWQLQSIGIVGVAVLLLSSISFDSSATGIYGGRSASDALRGFPPFAGLLYSATPLDASTYNPQAVPTIERLYGFLTVPNDDGTLYVPFVLTDSPAAKAGLVAGDTIYAVDGVSMNARNTVQLSKQMDASEHSTVSIGMTGNAKSVRLAKADMRVPQEYAYVSEKAVDASYFFASDGSHKKFNSLEDLRALARYIATHATQYDIEMSEFSPFVLAIFWMTVDVLLVVLIGIPLKYLTSPRKWFWTVLLCLGALVVIPALVVGFFLSFGSSETFRMFAYFGVHRSSGFLDLAGLFNALFLFGFWLLILGLTNLVFVSRFLIKTGR